jgi:hypothetical protein
MISEYDFFIFFLGLIVGVGSTYLSKLWYKYQGIEYGPYIKEGS